MPVVEKLPRAEAPHVPVADLGSGVEDDAGTPVRIVGQAPRRRMPKRPRHAEVDDERAPARHPPQEVLPPALDRCYSLADERIGDESRFDGTRQANVVDLGLQDRRALEHRSDLPTDGLDFGQLGHGAIVRTPTRRGRYAVCARRGPPRRAYGGAPAGPDRPDRPVSACRAECSG